MFCTNCGQQFEGNFCPNCGQQANASIPPLKSQYIVDIGEISFDLNLIIRVYGLGTRKVGAYAYVSQKSGVSISEAKSIIDPIIQYHISQGEKTGVMDGSKAQMELTAWEKTHLSSSTTTDKQKPLSKRQRIKENKKNAIACCPKCGSTSLSANKKGYSFVKGAIGGGIGSQILGVGAVMGLGAGNIGSKKVIVTCLNCGHQWKP